MNQKSEPLSLVWKFELLTSAFASSKTSFATSHSEQSVPVKRVSWGSSLDGVGLELEVEALRWIIEPLVRLLTELTE